MHYIMSTLEYVFGIVTLLGGVIAVHEFGHFIFAKWCNTRVDTFSIGFGPKLFAKKWGETEYCLSLIPLGGFVKIHGQDPDEFEKEEHKEPERALFRKSFWERIGVYIGGPLFNYILAVLIFAFMAMAGNQKLPATATRVVANTPAYDAGLRSGDQISAIAGEKVTTFNEVVEAIAKNPGKKLPMQIVRDQKTQTVSVAVASESGHTPYGEVTQLGNLDGLEPIGRAPIVGSTKELNPLGLKNGDQILAINNVAVDSWEAIEAYFESLGKQIPKTLAIKVKRSGSELTVNTPDLRPFVRSMRGQFSTQKLFDSFGLYTPELFIQQAVDGAPAALAGVKKNDRIVSANGERIYSFEHLRSVIQKTGEKLSQDKAALANGLALTIERNGELMNLRSAILETKGKDPLGNVIFTYTIGIQSAAIPKLPENMILERTWNPAKALWIGFSDTWDNTVVTVVGIKKLAFGEVSLKAVGGPIMIGKIAGDTLSSRGWRDFLRIMAIISISLGVFNLLPVPILDGGHVVFAIIEAARGKPLSPSAMQLSLKVGLSLLLVLMVFAVFNDIMKMVP